MGSIVFDMDGVLFDSEILVLRCWEETAREHNIPDISTACHACLGSNAIESKQRFLKLYGADFPYDEYKSEMSARYWAYVESGGLKLKPGVLEFLRELKARDWKTAIASSTRTEVILRELEMFGLECFIDEVVGGDTVKKSKPDPEIYLTACKRLHALSEETYAVEDSYNGIRSAANAGTKAVMIPDLLPPTPEMKKLASAIFPNMSELKAYLFD